MRTKNLLVDQEFSFLQETDAAMSGWNIEAVQLKPGITHSKLQIVRVADLQVMLNEESHPCHVNWTHDGETTSFAFYRPNSENEIWCGLPVKADDVLITSSGRDHASLTPAGLSSIFVTFETNLLDRYGVQELCRIDTAQNTTNGIAKLGTTGRRLRKLLFSLFDQPHLWDQFSPDDLQDHIMFSLGDMLCKNSEKSKDFADLKSAATWKTVARALEAISSSQQFFSSRQLADAICVSPRLLYLSFRQELGISPAKFIRFRRLQNARFELAMGNSQSTLIKQVASKHGFRDFGRFSEYYKRQYGELPSDTLRKQ
ncbi:helix-turn-helix transcriptional regulator [Ruegeria sp. HKCCA4812]|uniref:helix-turn-helix transcriptional regulator n=1 Tax=Ruegeria sp. HKCCA4812 TaxID=2682993 RepID=UPI001488F36C|nr:helix-turn-helix transcriptional regulator [Ruegeria sp. HKCCA4812]